MKTFNVTERGQRVSIYVCLHVCEKTGLGTYKHVVKKLLPICGFQQQWISATINSFNFFKMSCCAYLYGYTIFPCMMHLTNYHSTEYSL